MPRLSCILRARSGRAPRFTARLSGTLLAVLTSASLVGGEARADQSASNTASKDESAATREAAIRYDRALRHYAEGDYRLALIEMQRAHDLAPDYRVLYNIGQIHAQLNESTKALSAFRRYLAEGGSEIPAARLAQVEHDIANLETKVAHVRVRVSEDGAVVFLDDAGVGTTPLPQSSMVDAGEHRLRVEKAGFKKHEQVLVLAGGDDTTVNVVLEALPVESSASAGNTTWIWAGWGTTAALAIGAGITGGLAYRESRELARIRDQPMALAADRDAAEQRALNLGITSTILTGAAVVAGGVSLFLTLRHLDSQKKTRVGLAPAPFGMIATGEF